MGERRIRSGDECELASVALIMTGQHASSRKDNMEVQQNSTQRSSNGTSRKLDHPLISADRVTGSEVYNQAHEKIGRIEDIAVDKQSGQVAYAILSFGGLLGMGEKHQPLPWSALNYDTDLGGYVVDVTKELLELAPKLDVSDLSGWDDTSSREQFFSYYAPYGARPYW